MKKKILRSALYSSLLIAAFSFASCKKNADTDTDTESMETDSAQTENIEPARDTVVEKDGDTVVKMEGGENKAPAADQVP